MTYQIPTSPIYFYRRSTRWKIHSKIHITENFQRQFASEEEEEKKKKKESSKVHGKFGEKMSGNVVI